MDAVSEATAKFWEQQMHLVVTVLFKEQLALLIFRFHESESYFRTRIPLDKSC
jgi:hypothetical protein